MQKVRNILTYFKTELNNKFNDREVASWAYLSIHHILGFSKSDYILNANKKLTKANKMQFMQIVNDLKNEKPIQYILGTINFFGMTLKVNKNVLIPRPETEELICWILESKFKSALDIGTGSGCIAIVLANNTQAKINAIDISNKALNIAKENAKINKVDINFLKKDILNTNYLPKVDLIVSNPPYVLKREKIQMKENVLSYEPHLALFVSDNDPLIFYKKIGQLATKTLNCNGKLFFEIHEKYAKEIIDLLNDLGFVNIKLKKDINDKDRMIKAVWK